MIFKVLYNVVLYISVVYHSVTENIRLVVDECPFLKQKNRLRFPSFPSFSLVFKYPVSAMRVLL